MQEVPVPQGFLLVSAEGIRTLDPMIKSHVLIVRRTSLAQKGGAYKRTRL